MVSVIATTPCMACTSPISNETTSGENNIVVSDPPFHHMNPTEIMFQDYYIKYYNRPSCENNSYSTIIVDESRSSLRYKKMKFRQNMSSNRFNRGKSNKMNRTYGNIHQPGRTNCTQRFHSK